MVTFTPRLRCRTVLTAGAGLLGIACATGGDTTGPTQPPPVSSVSVTPGSQSILAGATSQFAATTKSAAGTVLTGRTVTWASSDVALATVSPMGLVTGVAPGGLVTITARSEGVAGTASVTVLGSTVYDAVHDINWLADGDLPSRERFGLPLCACPGSGTCINANGSMHYDAAVAWVAAMNAANYLGHSTWQLPTSPVSDSGCGRRGPNGNPFGFGCVVSALATLYNGLGLKAPASADPATTGTVGPFRNIQPYLYWSCSGATIHSACAAAGPSPNFEWSFSFGSGFEGTDLIQNTLFVTVYFAVHLAGGRTHTRTFSVLPDPTQ